MLNRRILVVALLALLAGLTVGYLQGGQAATASGQTAASVMPVQSGGSGGPMFSPLKSYPAIVAQPLPNAAASRQLSTLSDASGAMCDAESD